MVHSHGQAAEPPLLLQSSFQNVLPREAFHLVDAHGLFGDREERNLWLEPLRSQEPRSQHKTTESYREKERCQRGAQHNFSRESAGMCHPSSRPRDRWSLRRATTLMSVGPSPGLPAAFNINNLETGVLQG